MLTWRRQSVFFVLLLLLKYRPRYCQQVTSTEASVTQHTRVDI